MALLSFWTSNKDAVLGLNVQQVLTNAGDGNLRDDSPCSTEFRTFLGLVPSDRLAVYARHCLESKFDESGFVLQDIVNEIGRRLEFAVEPGLYHGKRNAVGFDGIWSFPAQPDLIVEVKTTDAYTVKLDKIAEYRDKLVAEQRVGRDASILIVVGRQDTGALEAQVRGSRHAWDIRLISVESLIKVLQISEKSDDPGTLTRSVRCCVRSSTRRWIESST